MPFLLDAPVLKVDAEAIHRLDTRDPQSLFSVWTVFARCADSVSQGRRLENLSWRLWTRETFCVDPGNLKNSQSTDSLRRHIERKMQSSTDDMPQLSGSVDSAATEEAIDFSAEVSPVDIDRPRICRQDSCASSRSRGKERHITSDDFEKLVVDIVHTKEPLVAPLPVVAMPVMVSKPPAEEKAATLDVPTAPALERSGSTSDSDAGKVSSTQSVNSSEQSTSPATQFSPPSHPVIRGFSTSHIPMSQNVTSHPRPSPIDPIPEPTSSPAAKTVQSKKRQAKFALGGSSSCDDSLSDRGHSPEVAREPVPQIKRKMFQVGGSSEEDNSLKSAMHSARSGGFPAQRKQTSFSNQLVTSTIPAPPVENDQSETEADDVDESAIDDDDDSSDWEDSVEESGKSNVDVIDFQRVDSKVNLTSRRSLITLGLAGKDGQSKLGNAASQSTPAIHQGRPCRQGPSFVSSPNDSDDGPLMMKRGSRGAPLKPINEIPRSAAQPILTPAPNAHHQAALSPRTTRRNMLSTELTESLRRHLVWERSQKSSTVNAVLKRRHTSHDVPNLKQYPDKVVMKNDADFNASSYDQYFGRDGGYHSKGW